MCLAMLALGMVVLVCWCVSLSNTLVQNIGFTAMKVGKNIHAPLDEL